MANSDRYFIFLYSKKRIKMKLNTLFFAAICAGTLFSSCVDKTAKERQLKYTHTSLVDGDAFAIFQKVGEAAQTGVVLAEQTEANGDAASKAVASKVKAFYAQLLPSLDTIATALHVDFPIKGIPAVETVVNDSTVVASVAKTDYVHDAIHEIAFVKEQLKRLSRNTNEDLRKLGKEQLHLATELYTQIGGKEEAHAGH